MVKIVFDLRVMYKGWQLGDGGVQPNPSDPHFWRVIAEAHMCPKHFFYTVFCLPVSRDFLKNVEILGFLNADQAKTL